MLPIPGFWIRSAVWRQIFFPRCSNSTGFGWGRRLSNSLLLVFSCQSPLLGSTSPDPPPSVWPGSAASSCWRRQGGGGIDNLGVCHGARGKSNHARLQRPKRPLCCCRRGTPRAGDYMDYIKAPRDLSEEILSYYRQVWKICHSFDTERQDFLEDLRRLVPSIARGDGRQANSP